MDASNRWEEVICEVNGTESYTSMRRRELHQLVQKHAEDMYQTEKLNEEDIVLMTQEIWDEINNDPLMEEIEDIVSNR